MNSYAQRVPIFKVHFSIPLVKNVWNTCFQKSSPIHMFCIFIFAKLLDEQSLLICTFLGICDVEDIYIEIHLDFMFC
jgi:hypothetical protein